MQVKDSPRVRPTFSIRMKEGDQHDDHVGPQKAADNGAEQPGNRRNGDSHGSRHGKPSNGGSYQPLTL